MFGESLPPEFHQTLHQVESRADLVLVMGTALAVTPFNMLPEITKHTCPKALFNMTNLETIDFTEPNSYRLYVEGECDATLRKLATDCGWTDDFEAILPDFHKSNAAANPTPTASCVKE